PPPPSGGGISDGLFPPSGGGGAIPFFNSIENLFNSGIDFDVLNICTPNGLHAEHALKALENKKHIVIEKPMALKVADCEKIILKAQQVSRKVFCVMQNRYSPPSAWIKNVLEKKLIGRIFLVQINCYWNRDERYYSPPAPRRGEKSGVQLPPLVGRGAWKGT